MSYELRLALYRAPLLFLAAFGLAFSGLLAPIAFLLAYMLANIIESVLLGALLDRNFYRFGHKVVAYWRSRLSMAISGILGLIVQSLLF